MLGRQLTHINSILTIDFGLVPYTHGKGHGFMQRPLIECIRELHGF